MIRKNRKNKSIELCKLKKHFYFLSIEYDVEIVKKKTI